MYVICVCVRGINSINIKSMLRSRHDVTREINCGTIETMMKLTVNYKDTSSNKKKRSAPDQIENNEVGISRKSILVVRKVVENIKLQLLRITQQLIALTCFVNSSWSRWHDTRRRLEMFVWFRPSEKESARLKWIWWTLRQQMKSKTYSWSHKLTRVTKSKDKKRTKDFSVINRLEEDIKRNHVRTDV